MNDLNSQLRGPPHKQLRYQLGDQLRDQLWIQLWGQQELQSWNLYFNQIRTQQIDQLWDHLSNKDKYENFH